MIVEILVGLALQEACLTDGQRITGELRYVDTNVPDGDQPGGMGMRAAFLVLPEAACLVDENGRAEGRWVQLAYESPLMFNGILRGSTIVVEASHYALPTTPWHIGDFVAFDVRVINHEPMKR